MNKRILSLVCIALYILLSVSIYCSQQKVSDVGNKSFRGIKEGNRRNEKIGIEFKNCNISEISMPINEYLNSVLLIAEITRRTNALKDYIAKNPRALKFVLLLKQELKQLSSDKKYPLKVTFSMENVMHEFLVNDPKHLKYLLRIIEDLGNHHSIDI
ncbi:fam-c protein [Plasmodium vinckei lentum]|uniref:Fam-c protein n=1 Tax=Plasmodium vinckei lentum TaxID=138297 RepID=A0A6V7RT01_PLAVN|nr:fam-c protein [Plasmodium vinckei lentum]